MTSNLDWRSVFIQDNVFTIKANIRRTLTIGLTHSLNITTPMSVILEDCRAPLKGLSCDMRLLYLSSLFRGGSSERIPIQKAIA